MRVGVRTWCPALCGGLLTAILCWPVAAQLPGGGSGDGGSAFGGSAVPGAAGQNGLGEMPGGAPGVAPGGAAMADFATLINLIEMTIDPDSWLNAGGQSSIQPYPAGVYVDPLGHMRRVAVEADALGPALAAAPGPRHPWRTSSQLRTVSLRQLDAALGQALRQRINVPQELQRLAGLSRIEFVRVDAAHEDVLLSGPAGESPIGMLLEDVALIVSLINHQTEPLGCSIEPRDAGIVAVQQLFQRAGALEKLSRQPQLVTEQMQATIGPHQVSIFGIPANTSTALALVDADEHMKQLGFGTVATDPAVKSYFDFLDQQRTVPEQSLIRWWFAYADDPVRANTQQGVFQLPHPCVAVISEQQWVGRQGRQPTGKQDPAADAFAEEISGKLNALRQSQASYARLCSVFESSLALQLALESAGQANWQAWFPNLCDLGGVTSTASQPPQTVEGLTTWHRLRSGTVVAVVSGGVKVDPRATANPAKQVDSQFLATSNVPEPPSRRSSAHDGWWWD